MERRLFPIEDRELIADATVNREASTVNFILEELVFVICVRYDKMTKTVFGEARSAAGPGSLAGGGGDGIRLLFSILYPINQILDIYSDMRMFIKSCWHHYRYKSTANNSITF